MTTPQDEPDTTLKPPQFTLRTLLVAVTALAVLLAVMTAVGSLWSLGVLLLLSLVAAHVVGNALGTKLRDRSTGTRTSGPPDARARRLTVVSSTRLAQRARLHWMALVLSGGGALVGGYFGGSALAANYPEASTAAVVLGVVSSGVLGGFAGFMASSFLFVARQALTEAHAASDKHHPHGVRRSSD